MRYKVLLTGNNKTVINDFFSHLDENIELMTTSLRFEDILAHIKYFKPEAFCYCVSNEAEEHITQMVSLKTNLEDEKIPFVVIGSKEDCAEFGAKARGVADYVLQKPLKASAIEEALIKYIDGLRYAEQMRVEELKRLEEEMRRAKFKHILVVDDDASMLKVIKEQLHNQYEVATALNGKTALKFLEKKTTDLILLDYEMPNENGAQVLEKLRANEATKDIPVIFLTGVTERAKIAQVLVMKPQGYLLKPIEHDKLIEAIRGVLGE